jgi:hypothetical protein
MLHAVKTQITGTILTSFLLVQSWTAFSQAEPLYVKPTNAKTHWSSFENLSGAHGSAAKENKGGKGHAWDSIAPGETKTLMDAKGAGMITRMWLTIDDRSTETLRSLRLDMFWDNADKPAVSAPFGDFFNAMLAEPTRYENELFSTGEGRSFNCFIPMPFRKAGRVTLTNETKRPLKHLFYDIDYVMDKDLPAEALYFHAHWRRSNPTTVGQDFEILPKVTGKGRFLGSNIAVAADKKTLGWWGEGEAKVYLDSDTEFPSLAGTGTEDYIGTAWGQKVYVNRYQGCLVANDDLGHFSFYRYHVPDPVYFDTAARVTIQQIGGTGKNDVLKMMKEGRPVKPVSLDIDGKFVRLLDMPEGSLEKHNSPDDAWCNYYRQDDVTAISFFYLDKPQSNLPSLAPVAERTALSRFDK